MAKCDRNCFSCPYADCILDYEDFDGKSDETTVILFPKGYKRERTHSDTARAERQRKMSLEYYYAHREECSAYHAQYYAKNREAILAKRREYYQRTKETAKAKQKERYQQKKEGNDMVVEVVTTKNVKDTEGVLVNPGDLIYFTDGSKAYVGRYEGIGARGALVFDHIEGKGRFSMMPTTIKTMYHISDIQIMKERA